MGTFIADIDGASFDSQDHVFYPSRVRIAFSSNEKEDSLLLNSLTRQLHLSNKESLDYIQEFVERINSRLDKNKYCKLEGLGYLIKDFNDKVVLKDIFWKKQHYHTLGL